MFVISHAGVRRTVAAAIPLLGLGVSPIVPAQSLGASLSDTVVVTATRTPQRVDQALAQVTVIDRARIEAAAGRTLAELLATESGVQA
ncbi:MAG: hypothetical protein RJA10_1472, partial [Pseudomonadota bacterium]